MAKLELKQQQKTRISAGTKTVEDDIRKSTKDLLNDINRSWFDISRNLFIIESEQQWRNWGYRSMEEYVQEELGYEYRNMRHRIGVGRTIVNLGLTHADIEQIGEWTKIKAIVPLLNRENITRDEVDVLLEKAKNSSVRDLETFRRSLTEIGGKGVVVHKMSFKVTDAQNTVVERVFKSINENTGRILPGQILEYLCLQYELNNDLAPKNENVFSWALNNLDKVKEIIPKEG